MKKIINTYNKCKYRIYQFLLINWNDLLDMRFFADIIIA